MTDDSIICQDLLVGIGGITVSQERVSELAGWEGQQGKMDSVQHQL